MAGQLIKRGDRTFLLRVYLGRDSAGKRKYHNQTFHGTKAEAERHLRSLVTKRDQGVLRAGGEVRTLAQYSEHWLRLVVRKSTRERTYLGYKEVVDRYLVPKLGGVSPQELTAPMVRAALAELGEDGLGPLTLRRVRGVLRNMLTQAAVDGLIQANPAGGGAVGRSMPKVEKVERPTVRPDQVGVFLEAARGDRLGGLWVLLLMGLRPGEALALRWQDIRDGWLSVRRVLVDRSESWPRYEPPKTERSARTLRLPQIATDALAEHRRRQLAERLAAGAAWRDNDLVVCTELGEPYRQASLRAPFGRLLARAGLPHMRTYDMRHSCATLLLEAGADLETVKQWLGHSSIRLTSDTYGGLVRGIQDRAPAALDRLAAEGG